MAELSASHSWLLVQTGCVGKTAGQEEHILCVFVHPVSVLCLKIQDLCVIKAVYCSYWRFLNSSCFGIHLGLRFPVDIVGVLSLVSLGLSVK